jgi:heme/copper-type cytochrome/quinol oxidase subunit 4
MPEKKDSLDLPENEWEAARKVLSDFDERRHDIRKYGISFVAGLLTAQSFLEESASVSHHVKLAVVGATMVLIFALRLTEKDYELYQLAAAKRAVELEPTLHYDLTGTIAREYEHDHMWILVDITYLALAGSAGLLGYFLLSPTLAPNLAAIVDITATIVTGIFIVALRWIIPTTKLTRDLRTQVSLTAQKKQ